MTHDLEGPVVWKGDPSYEQLRQAMLWNARKPGRFPEAIVRAASDRDVAGAMRLARSRGLGVAVRAGGHSWIGSPLRDGTVLIDLSALRAVHVDQGSATATLEPAVTSAEVASILAGSGFAFPVGHCASVGMGGYLLSGGLGWNSGAWGPACASVFAVDVVTSDGDLVHATEEHEAELLWAARGAGPGFPGVVTRFHVGLQALPRAITTTTHVFDMAGLDEIAPWASGVAASLPTMVELTVMLTEAGRDLPADPARKVAVVTATAFADTADEAAAALAPVTGSPFRDRRLVGTDLAASPYDALYRDFGGRWREGSRFASDNVWTDADLAEALLALRGPIVDAPGPSSFAFAAMSPDPPAGQVEEELPDMAFSMYARTFVACYAMWDDAAADDVNLAWLPASMAEVDRDATGHYVAEADLQSSASRAERSFSPQAWERLRTLRDRIDPDGLLASYLEPAAGSVP
jgi:FAD/FMN-containing dehydrogenase